jgi:hypothetical protein
MAPEFPVDLIVVDMRFEGGELIGQCYFVERQAEGRDERLHVTWNADAPPKDFYPIAGGAISVANKPTTTLLDYEVKPDAIGNGRYAWMYNTLSDLMMVLVFPEGYVPDDCKPYPVRAKTFKGRVVAYWRFGEDGAEVRWTMRQSQIDLAHEVIRINERAVRRPNRTIGAVTVDEPIESAKTQMLVILLGVINIAYLMSLIFLGPKDLSSQYQPIVRFIAALASGLLAGLFAGRLNLEGRLPAFADGIAGNSLGIAAAGGFAMFVFVWLFWGR